MATITQITTATVTKTVTSASASSTHRAAPQGGILEGSNPSRYDPKNPIFVFIIQAGIIIIFCRLLHWPLSKMRQPRVIAEVIGGVLLGPSVMGRIPGFTDAIFPAAAMPNLTLIANIGLILFLFLVGLEVDLRYMASNLRVAVSVGALGMIIPFGLGCAIAYGLYHEFRDEPGTEPISFGTYMLFIGVAMAITAFPVLCRILTELKLLSTPVGIVVLSAGVSNDVVGWVLLALCVALVNAGSGITALYVLLVAVGFVLFLAFVVRPAFLRLLRHTGSLENGPSQSIVALTLLIALASAFMTGVIGIHPIFGAFMAGLICPHEGGFAIKVTEKVEDLVSTIFLPLYFALSGLSTNLGLLNTGITWGYVFAVIIVAFCAKFAGGTIAARLNGLVWRESFAIGALMSCKGLVELIVLNIGLQAKILSVRTFTIFVVMALVTTFATTPLTTALYPPWYQKKLEAWKRGEIDWDSGRPVSRAGDGFDDSILAQKGATKIGSLLVYLRFDNMPSLIALVSLLGGKPLSPVANLHPSKNDAAIRAQGASGTEPNKRPIEVHGVRLMELTDRASSVMKVSEVDEYSARDPLVNTFRTLGRLYNLAVSGEVSIGPQSSFSDILTSKAADESSDLLLLPWNETGQIVEQNTIGSDAVRAVTDDTAYSQLVARALDTAVCTTVVFVDKGFGGQSKNRPSALRRSLSALSSRSRREYGAVTPLHGKGHHVFMPFFGGADDKVALRLLLQIAENPVITATIVYFQEAGVHDISGDASKSPEVTANGTQGSAAIDTQGSVVLFEPQARATREQDAAFFATLQRSLPDHLADRVVFETRNTSSPAADAVARARDEVAHEAQARSAGNLIVLGRNRVGASQPKGCLGRMTEMVYEDSIKASILVVKARSE